MQPIEQSCDTTQIDDYLAGNLGIQQQAKLEAHLTACELCRQRLETRAAEQDVWDSARSLLSHDRDLPVEDSDSESTGVAGVQPGSMVLDSLAPTDDPEMLGRLGEYEISGVVGVGGMGAVLRGFDKSLRRVVAIKVMAPHLAGSGPARTRFQREARAAAAITHDNIIDIYGVAEANGLPYIVMPFARGPSLQNRIDRSGPLTAVEVVRIGKQIASGLAAAHEQGLVHRDIKPANILLNEGIERLWITDFGVARAMDDASMTKTGVIAGTPQYMSPEQARGESVDHRSDLFSLGSVLYTACTGRAPFRSEAAYGILRRITDTDPRPIREINPDIPDWLSRIIGRLMAKHPDNRFQTAAEVAELLEGCLAHMQQPTQVALPPCIAAADSPSHDSDELGQSRQTEVVAAGINHRKPRWIRSAVGVLIASLLLTAMGALAWQATAPVDITGTWKGENWATVSLSSVDEATGWYNGTFTDDEGHRGAIQLEWSRVQRRYNGRWKSGDDQSGSITLRAGDTEEVRGAVSADPESSVRPNRPRLREFSWHRTDTKAVAASIEQLPEWRKRVGKPQSITVPEKGVIVRLGDGVQENSRLTKGELIAVLAPNDAERREQLESQLNALQQQVEASKAVLSTKMNEIKVAMTNFEAAKKRQATFEKIQHEIVAGADAAVAVEANKVTAAQAQLAALKASFEQLQTGFDQKKEIRQLGLISEEELQTAEAQLKGTKAQVAAAENKVQAATNALRIKEKDRNAKEARAQVDIDDAKASVSNAETALSEAEAEIEIAKSKVVNAEKRVLDIRLKLTEVERLHILAPQDGYITNLGMSSTQVVKQGDALCLFWPDQAESTKQELKPKSAPDNEQPSRPSATEASVLNSLPPKADETGHSLMAALGTATSLAKRVRECQSNLDAAEADLSTNRQSADVETLQRSLDELRGEMATLDKEKATITKMLQTRRDAAKELQKFQADLTEQMVAGAEAGRISEHELTVAQHSLVKANRELALLDQLLSFYANLGEADIAAERKSIIEILKNLIETAQELYDLQATITTRVTFAFKHGKLSIDESLDAQKALTKAKSEQRELELLFDYYTDLETSDDEPNLDDDPSAKESTNTSSDGPGS